MIIDNAVPTSFKTGSIVVGTSPVPIGQQISWSGSFQAGVHLIADPNNTDVVWVGDSVDVTPGTTPATDGFPLFAKNPPIFIPGTMFSLLRFISGTANQKVYFFAY